MEATLSSKNQVTIPKPVREYLNLKPGDRFKFFLQPDGAVVILPKIRTSKLKGSVPKLSRPISIEEMDAAIEDWRDEAFSQMTGLDTNILLRYLLQVDPKQARRANQIIDRQLSEQNPGFVNLATILEIVWVLRSLLKRSPSEIATHLEHLLAADSLEVQNEQQVFEAAFALKRGTGEFEDALIGALNAWAGCSHTWTFDRKTARLPYFQVMT